MKRPTRFGFACVLLLGALYMSPYTWGTLFLIWSLVLLLGIWVSLAERG
jgi:hypothetical protein